MSHELSERSSGERDGARTLRRSGAAAIAAPLLLAAGPAPAQHASPYAGQEARAIKSLSAEEVRDLELGAGMGFAKPAELNGYPGPRHVLELADALALRPDQRERVEHSFERMQRRAVEAGAELIEAERALDALFATGDAEAATLEAAVARAAAARARVRLAHLEAHLEMRELLDAPQVEAYVQLRGYGHGGHDPSRHH
jgi:Spy/CpxP family protein refolding chaperone